MDPSGWGEAQLWQQAASGDRTAFERLVHGLLPRIRQHLFRLGAFRLDVDDLTQEVFVRLIEGLERLQSPERGRAWVLGIAGNVWREFRRARRLPSLPAAEPASSGDPERGLVDEELEQRLAVALQELPAALHEVLVLSVYEGLTPAEIARALGLRREAVRHRLFRARRILEQTVFAGESSLSGVRP